LVPSFLVAQEIPNWTVPPYGGTRPAGELSTMADISPGVAFVAMQPCRVFDTRNANGPYGGPRLLANTTRNFDIDSGPCTGIPAGVDAYSMNFGAILPDGANSFVTIWPTGSAQPLVSSINPIQGGVVANAAIVPAGTNGQISVFPNTGMHLYGDINGYFTDRYNAGVSFHAVSTTGAPAIHGENTGTGYGVLGTSATGFGVVATTGGSAANAALWARNTSTGDFSSGVYGSATETGAVGTAGVWGQTESTGGPLGAWGVLGLANASTGRTYGVWGETKSTFVGAAGVFGLGGSGLTAGHIDYSNAGVRGESRLGSGVLGVTENFAGVRGLIVNPTNGNALAEGFLGYSGFANYGLYSSGPARVTGNLVC
jgi:hypothetical protein